MSENKNDVQNTSATQTSTQTAQANISAPKEEWGGISPYGLTVLYNEHPVTTTMPVWAWARLKRVGTHSGPFHADDVVGVALIKIINFDHKVEVIRSRDPGELALADIVFDVSEGPFDHHGARKEKDPAGVWFCGATRMWQAGLAEALLPGDNWAQAWFSAHALAPVALQDNGAEIPKGFAHPFSWVHAMNPDWDAEPGFDDPEPFDSHFEMAVNAAIPVVRGLLRQAKAASRGMNFLRNLDDEAAVVEIKGGIPDWGEYFAHRDPRFVIYKTGETWYTQCVPPPGDTFGKKVPFPVEWKGLRAEKLEDASGISGAVFCHSNLFLTGWTTRDAAIAAAYKAMELYQQ